MNEMRRRRDPLLVSQERIGPAWSQPWLADRR